jgi:hypothetical protein
MEAALTDSVTTFGYEKLFAGQRAQHAFALYHQLSVLLHENRQIRSIVELGTSMGAMSIYLGLWAVRLGIPMHTFDQDSFPFNKEHNIDDGAKPIYDALGIQTHWTDIFSDIGKPQVIEALGTEPAYLYCDNGSKKWEFYTFVPLMAPGSVVSVHDWPGEVGPADIEKAVEDHDLNLESWNADNWQPLALATWIVR